jgi:hypothetical protein
MRLITGLVKLKPVRLRGRCLGNPNICCAATGLILGLQEISALESLIQQPRSLIHSVTKRCGVGSAGQRPGNTSLRPMSPAIFSKSLRIHQTYPAAVKAR